MAVRKRRSQKERSAATSARLKEATIDLLLDRGIARTTTPEIAQRAGVSRGALTHHFASRDDIIAQSVQHQLRRVTDDLHRFAEEFADRGGSSDEIVDYLYNMMSSGIFHTTLEYLPEARHNPDFKARLIPVVREFHAGLDAVWSALAARAGTDPEHTSTAMNATMCLMRGMIAQTILRDDPRYFASMLDFWKRKMRDDFPILDTRRPAGRRAAGGAA